MGFFNIHSVAKHQKIEGGKFYFRKKISGPKKTVRGPFGIFHSDAKPRKKEGGPFGEKFFSKKGRSAEKMKGGPFGLARYGMLRGKTGKTLLVQFARPNSAIWCNNIL